MSTKTNKDNKMADKTGISWTDKTWNPIQGCRKVSSGCLNCYMFREKKRYGQDPLDVHVSAQATFNSPLRWKEPAKVFTCSWSDWFIEEFDERRPEAWDIIRRTPHLTYQILTKRPERIIGNLPIGGCPSNVMLGVTAENQEQWEKRVPILTALGMKNFVSVEPMLGPVEISPMDGEMVDWVICGGESGPGFREMKKKWALSLKAQCKELGIPFFFKQVSGSSKKKCAEIPEELVVQEFPE